MVAGHFSLLLLLLAWNMLSARLVNFDQFLAFLEKGLPDCADIRCLTICNAGTDCQMTVG